MSAPAGAPGSQGRARRHRAWRPDPQQRASDAERARVADLLSRHYGDGRLDQAEFDERLDRAMKAKTHADLSGLLADLPGNGPLEKAAREGRRRTPRILFLVLVILVAAAAGEALAHSYLPWLLIAMLVFLWLRYGPRQHRRDPG